MEAASPHSAPCARGKATTRSASQKVRKPAGTRRGGRLFLECSFGAPITQPPLPPKESLPEESTGPLFVPWSSAGRVACVAAWTKVQSRKRTPACLQMQLPQCATHDWCPATFQSTPPSCPKQLEKSTMVHPASRNSVFQSTACECVPASSLCNCDGIA